MTTISQPEYQYADSQLDHTYQYLTTPLLSMLPSAVTHPDGRKIRILDLGCGNGSLCNMLAKLGYEVVGVEESALGISLAQQHYPDCQFIRGSIYDLSSLNLANDFDVVISVEVIEHLFNPSALLEAAKHYLKPAGTLILTTPYHGYWKNLALAITGKLDGHFSALWNGGHIKFFSVATLTKLLETANLTDIQFKYAGRIPYLWCSMLCSCKIG
jgi:2-polyprenyl-3-methyl-5-hydroxy-6-metoxy-1,4-benzoquinol methylase